MAGRTAAVIQFNHLPQLKGEMRESASRHVRATLFRIQARIQSVAPVDTGYYRNSWTPGAPGNVFEMKPGDLQGVLGSAVEYGPFLEWGTRLMAPRPHVMPSVEAERQQFFDAMHHLIKGA